MDRKMLWKYNPIAKPLVILVASGIIATILYLWNFGIIFNFGVITPNSFFELGFYLYFFGFQFKSFFDLVTLITILLFLWGALAFFGGIIGDAINFAYILLILIFILWPFAFIQMGISLSTATFGMEDALLDAVFGIDVGWFVLLVIAYHANNYTFKLLDKLFPKNRLQVVNNPLDGLKIYKFNQIILPATDGIVVKGKIVPIQDLKIIPADENYATKYRQGKKFEGSTEYTFD